MGANCPKAHLCAPKAAVLPIHAANVAQPRAERTERPNAPKCVGGGNNRPFSDPDFDGREPREVLLLMGRAKRWLESRGFTIQLSGEYRKVEIKKVKFE